MTGTDRQHAGTARIESNSARARLRARRPLMVEVLAYSLTSEIATGSWFPTAVSSMWGLSERMAQQEA